MGKVIGIDLGTTNSCVSVVENEAPVIIPGTSGSMTTPSIVAFTKKGERLVGESARRQAVTNPERTISSVKRHMGTEWSVRIDGTEYKAQTISAMVLMQLKKDAEDFLSEPVTEAVITVPAYFNNIQRQATKDAGIAPSELGRVLLVGGSTRIPAVQEKVRMLTGKEPSKNINPDECVAKGAAILGHTLEGNSLIASGTDKGILLLDVTPLSLSIETVGGVATRLIERNTTLPTRYSRIFSTAAPYQRSVDIHVLQGERPMARDNKTIGKFRLKGIKAAPAGVPQIEVTFDIDSNGILKVSAKDLDTGKQQSITITANDSMSEQEIQQAIRDAHEYAGQDQTRKDAMEVLSDVQRLMSETEQKLKVQKKTLDHGTKKQIKNDLNRLNKLAMKCRLDKVSDAQLAELKEAKQKLEDSAAALS